MTVQGWLLIALFTALLIAVTKPFGVWLHALYEGRRTPLHRVLGPLERGGYATVEGANGRDALNSLAIDRPDVVLLDLGLLDRDGLELIPLIRAKSTARIIVVSARDQTDEKVAALDLGADDFVTKPFDTEELLARVRTARRNALASEADAPAVEIGDVRIDLAMRRVQKAGVELRLTPKQYGFLAELAKRPGRVLTYVPLLRAVWGPRTTMTSSIFASSSAACARSWAKVP